MNHCQSFFYNQFLRFTTFGCEMTVSTFADFLFFPSYSIEKAQNMTEFPGDLPSLSLNLALFSIFTYFRD